MREAFKYREFNKVAMGMIAQCASIMRTYDAAGFDLSSRQLYYQFVARDIFPADRKWSWTGSRWVKDPAGTINAEPNYKWLCDLVSEARLAGLLDWDMIKDRGRLTVSNPHWKSPAEICRTAADSFRIDLWATQPVYVEVMVEKQALEGVLIPVCREEDVSFCANKGYSSSSALYETGKRLAAKRKDATGMSGVSRKRMVVIYLGDHDPSGIDMTRDIQERLEMFSRGPVDVRRVALNMDQIEELNPPENPTKMTDSRASGYVEQFGESCWELDAIEPQAMADLTRAAIVECRDPDLWEEAIHKQEKMREALEDMAADYEQREDEAQ